MPQQRLRIVVPRYGSGVLGGAETLMRRLAETLSTRGRRVEVLTSCAVDARTWGNVLPPGETVEDGVQVRRFAVTRPRHPGAFHQASRVFWRLPAAARPERSWIVAQGPHSPSLVAALRNDEAAPTVFLPYLYEPFLEGVHVTRGARLLVPAAHDEHPLRLRSVARAVAACDGLWYSTPEERTLLERVVPPAVALPWRVGTTGVTPPAHPDAAQFRRVHDVGATYLLYGGRLVPGKGGEELLEGFRRLRAAHPAVELVLTGEAGRDAAAAGDGVRPVGFLDDAQRWNAIAGATAVVVPSPNESLSLLALEAWAVGRPVLANLDLPVLAGHLERGHGGLGYTSAAGLADVGSRILLNEGLASSLGLAGRAYVDREYRWDSVVDRLDSLLAQVSAAPASRGDAR